MLGQIRGVTLVDKAPVPAREIKQFNGALYEPVVAGHYRGGKQLKARVAVVHQLLVIGAIHVRLVSAHLNSANRQLDDAPQFGVTRIHAAFVLIRVSARPLSIAARNHAPSVAPPRRRPRE